ncbi:MAG TPA: sugar transferase, partial [Terricaulis sp.]|nr:sugar transferase [Terricaulis sp.]
MSRFQELRSLNAHRVTDPRLIRNVRRATGVGKRCFDFAVAALALLLLSPALLTIAALIKIKDPGPILFGHRRVGRQGGSFYCLKFRTMKMNAEEELQHILATDSEAAAEWNQTQKLRNDPRVTKLGAFLRKFSLDELPQLIN